MFSNDFSCSAEETLSEGTKRTEHYPAEIFDTWYHFGQNRSRNRIRKMAGYPANRNRNRISGTSVLITDISLMCVLQILCVAAVCSPRCTGAQICSNTGPTIRDNSCQCQQRGTGAGCEICMYTLYLWFGSHRFMKSTRSCECFMDAIKRIMSEFLLLRATECLRINTLSYTCHLAWGVHHTSGWKRKFSFYCAMLEQSAVMRQ